MIEQFEKYLRYEKRYSTHTLLAYIKDINQFYDFCSFDKKLIIEDSQLIRQWIVFLAKNSSKTTINRKISALKSFYKYIRKTKKIEINPLDKIITPKKPKRIPEFIPEQDLDNIDQIFTDNFSGYRDKLIITMLYATGIRRSELVNLKISDIDYYQKTIKVFGKRQKERKIPMAPKLIEEIDNYIQMKEQLEQANKEYLIVTDKGTKTNGAYIYNKVKKYLSILTTINKKSPHILRHTFATHLLNNGADLNAIKELLGHSNLSSTQVYTHNSFEKINKIYKKTHPRG